ncbi:MAG: protocatechuate 3,4-dioxygenase subunit beta, partial [Acetobacteraceae bacterium]|nr:protocatechuate 3,4-dioxygenase subunit beta [Acetobacteraceae bacterium]
MMSDLASYRRPAPGTQPAYDVPDYGSTHKRHPKQALVRLEHTLSEISGPRMTSSLYPSHADLSKANGREAMGERIIVAGRVLDEDGRPVRGAMVEIWQANAAGRYHHARDQHD